jgi:hypothetical protein
MKNRKISDAIGYLDGDLVSEAVTYKKSTVKAQILRWGALAACLMFVVMAAVLMIPQKPAPAAYVGGIERYYQNAVQAGEAGYYVFPWEYRTVSERFTTIELDGVYHSRNEAIREALLGETLGVCTAKGWDVYTDEIHTDTFTVREIKGVSSEYMVAVNMEGAYYVYMKQTERAPDTLGELIALYGLKENLRLEQYSAYENSAKKGYFRMKDGADIMALLCEYADAAAWHEAEAQSRINGTYISFTATSESLGLYKHVFSVTADGYISTNIFDYGYVYYIGEEAASRIIAYAKANSEETHSEPYEYTLAGTLTEIGDGYLLIDDGILCKNPKDGLVFRVPTDDIRIRRAVELERVEEGDIVVVRFRTHIDPETLTVSDARGIEVGYLMDGYVAVPE